MSDDTSGLHLPFWVTAELGQLVEVHYGKALSEKLRAAGGHFPVVGSSGIVGKHDKTIVEGPCIVVGRKGAAGSVHLLSESCWPIDTAYFIQPPDDLGLRYLSHQLGSFNLVSLDKSTAIPSLSRDDLYRVKVSVAPLAEQTRIVAKLEELLSDLDAGVAELKLAQKKLGQYRQSLLKAAVEGALTKEWREGRAKNSTTLTTTSSPPSWGTTARMQEVEQRREQLPRDRERVLSVRDSHGAAYSTSLNGPSPQPSPTTGEGVKMEEESGAQLLTRILKERRARWEAKQLAKFKEQNKAPPKDWQEKYPEPVKPDATHLPELPEGWVWASLSQVGWLDRGRSKHRPRNAPHLYGGSFPFVQTGEIRDADTFINKCESSYSEAGLAQSRLWPAGTLCITIAANIGKTAILGIEACFPDSIVGFLPATTEVSVRFVEYFMRAVQQKLEADAPATAQKNINLEILERVAMPLPTFVEQSEIVMVLNATFEGTRQQNEAIELGLKQSSAQRKNILKAAFAGQLVPQDPNDEPASVLLERICAERKLAMKRKPRLGRNRKETNDD